MSVPKPPDASFLSRLFARVNEHAWNFATPASPIANSSSSSNSQPFLNRMFNAVNEHAWSFSPPAPPTASSSSSNPLSAWEWGAVRNTPPTRGEQFNQAYELISPFFSIHSVGFGIADTLARLQGEQYYLLNHLTGFLQLTFLGRAFYDMRKEINEVPGAGRQKKWWQAQVCASHLGPLMLMTCLTISIQAKNLSPSNTQAFVEALRTNVPSMANFLRDCSILVSFAKEEYKTISPQVFELFQSYLQKVTMSGIKSDVCLMKKNALQAFQRWFHSIKIPENVSSILEQVSSPTAIAPDSGVSLEKWSVFSGAEYDHLRRDPTAFCETTSDLRIKSALKKLVLITIMLSEKTQIIKKLICKKILDEYDKKSEAFHNSLDLIKKFSNIGKVTMSGIKSDVCLMKKNAFQAFQRWFHSIKIPENVSSILEQVSSPTAIAPDSGVSPEKWSVFSGAEYDHLRRDPTAFCETTSDLRIKSALKTFSLCTGTALNTGEAILKTILNHKGKLFTTVLAAFLARKIYQDPPVRALALGPATINKLTLALCTLYDRVAVPRKEPNPRVGQRAPPPVDRGPDAPPASNPSEMNGAANNHPRNRSGNTPPSEAPASHPTNPVNSPSSPILDNSGVVVLNKELFNEGYLVLCPPSRPGANNIPATPANQKNGIAGKELNNTNVDKTSNSYWIQFRQKSQAKCSSPIPKLKSSPKNDALTQAQIAIIKNRQLKTKSKRREANKKLSQERIQHDPKRPEQEASQPLPTNPVNSPSSPILDNSGVVVLNKELFNGKYLVLCPPSRPGASNIPATPANQKNGIAGKELNNTNVDKTSNSYRIQFGQKYQAKRREANKRLSQERIQHDPKRPKQEASQPLPKITPTDCPFFQMGSASSCKETPQYLQKLKSQRKLRLAQIRAERQ